MAGFDRYRMLTSHVGYVINAGTAMHYAIWTFGHARLDRRGVTILDQMLLTKTVCPRLLGAELAAERFFDTPKVTPKWIIESLSQQTRSAVARRRVLRSRTPPNCNSPPGRTGLGNLCLLD